MKKANLLFSLVILCGCGNFNYSSEPSPAGLNDLMRGSSALVLTVKNSLPEQQIGEQRAKPNLNAYFCSPIPAGKTPVPTTDERCIRLAGAINNGKTQTFFVSKQDLTRVYERGQGKATFEFADDYQLTSVPWHCSVPNDHIDLASNLEIKQTWSVEVNQRFGWSYGCLIDRK